MNSRSIVFGLFSTLALISQMEGWTRAGVSEEAEQPKVKSTDDRGGFFAVDYLFWKPALDDLNYGYKGFINPDSDPATFELKVKKPNFDLSSGVRVALGGYTSDVWDVGLRGTYLYSKATGKAHANIDEFEIVGPNFMTAVEGTGGTYGSAHWQMNYGVLDFFIGRDCRLSEKFVVHPFIGARGAWIHQRMKGRYDSFFQAPGPNPLLPISYTMSHDVSGGGPRVGIDFDYYFSRGWAFKGGLSGAFLYSTFHVKQKTDGWNVGSGGSQIALRWSVKDRDSLVRANLEGYFGLGWDRWFNQNRSRFYIALLCESSYWFGMNQFYDSLQLAVGGTSNPNTTFVNEKRSGDLSFFGGTLHVQFDF